MEMGGLGKYNKSNRAQGQMRNDLGMYRSTGSSKLQPMKLVRTGQVILRHSRNRLRGQSPSYPAHRSWACGRRTIYGFMQGRALWESRADV